MFDRREGDLQGLAMKLESVEKECSEGKLERVQLAADFKNIKDQKTSLSKEVRIALPLIGLPCRGPHSPFVCNDLAINHKINWEIIINFYSYCYSLSTCNYLLHY